MPELLWKNHTLNSLNLRNRKQIKRWNSSTVLRGRCSARLKPSILVCRNDSPGGDRVIKKKEPKLDIQDASQTVVWGGRLPSRRRAITGGLSGMIIVLGSNFAGITGALLGLDGGNLAGSLHLDVLYPVKGFKRCYDVQNGFEFQYPASWLADQQMFRRNAQRREQGLDLPSARLLQRRSVAEPVAAFGPAGGSGELNISAIAAPIEPTFQLSNLGNPQEAALRFLNTFAAPPGSGLETNLIAAFQRRDEGGHLYYSLEYTIERPDKFFRHNISTISARNGTLYTLNAQSPEVAWEANEGFLKKAATSFQIHSGKGPLSSPGPLLR